MKNSLFIIAILCFAVLLTVTGCPSKEPVVINADDVTYGSEGKTVGDTLDTLGHSRYTDAEARAAVDLSGYAPIGHGHTGYAPQSHNHTALNDTLYAPKSHNHTASDITDFDSKVKAAVSGTATGSDCPSGYSKVAPPSGKSWVICTKGKDVMVKVGQSFWIDRHEMGFWGGPNCTLGKYLVADAVTNKGFKEPQWSIPFYSCSTPYTSGGVDGFSYNMTYHQAQMACLNSNKHLCTNAEWQMAAAGTDPKNCNFKTPTVGLTPQLFPNCVSKFGAEQMLGNVPEWVAGLVLDGGVSKALLRGGSIEEYSATIEFIKLVNPGVVGKYDAYGARCCISGAGR